MSFTIVKWWPAAPQAKQPAIRRILNDRGEAERIKGELEREMPDRRFAIEERLCATPRELS